MTIGFRMGEQPMVLDLVARVAVELGEAKVRYCHWKSNEAIDRSLSGENDLDLLIDRADASRFFEVMSGLGFTIAIPPTRKRMPGLVGLYGLDRATGRIVQVDAHFQLIVGDDTTKNYRLPIEDAYLADLDTTGPLPLPRPEFEYLAFVIRMVLKHSPWDAQLSYKARLTATEKRELAHLSGLIDPAEVERLRADHLPMASVELLERCRLTLGRDLGAVDRAVIARDLVRVLSDYGRRPTAVDIGLKLYRRAEGQVLKRLPWVNLRKRLVSGGSVVAFIGGDGSGKSTAVAETTAFLSRHFFVRRFHLGKPTPSFSSRLFRKVARRIPTGVPPGIPAWEAAELAEFPGYPYLITHLATARDRYRTHLAARRAAARGAVVICDRYPLAGLATMDCPRLQELPGLADRRLARWMSRREASFYRRIQPPDAVIVMRVDPEVAVRRRAEQDEEFVRRRAAEIRNRSWTEPGFFVVDANQPLQQVVTEVKGRLWATL